MAMTPFTAGGISYEVDDQGTIYQGGRQVPPEVARNVDVQAAAAAAQNPAPTTTTPAAAPTSTTPPAPTTSTTTPSTNAYGTKGEPAYSSTNPPPSAPPPAAPTTNTSDLPASPPRAGVRVDTVNRKEREALQKQLDDLQKLVDPSFGPTSPQATVISALNTRIASLSEQISKNETPPTKQVRSAGGPDDPWVIIDNGDGTVTATPRPGVDASQIKPQVVSHGNRTFVVTPPTKDELAKDPAAAAHVTVAYTDTDAQVLAQRTAAVAEKNAATAAAAQATNDYAARAKADLDERVSRREDAASVRAEQAQKLQELHDAWVRADGDRRAAQQELDSYNTNRHAVAQETLQQAQIDATAKAQAAQDATQRYGYKTSAETSRYATDVAARTAKMQVGNQFLQNALTTLSEINKALPPGSDLAGKALEGMLAYGQKFLEGMGGPAPVAPSLDGTAPATDQVAVDKGAVPPIDVQPASAPSAETVSANTTGAAVGTAIDQARQAATVGNAFGNAFNQPGPSGGLDWLFGSSASPVANPATVAAANQATTDAQAAAIAAQHQANMAPDGTPWTKPGDVARVFGRGGNT